MDKLYTALTSADEMEIDRIKAKLSLPGRNRSRDLQKLELLELRVEAATLQKNIDELNTSSGVQSIDFDRDLTLAREENPNKNLGFIRRGDEIVLSAWRGLAKKQKRLRREAENDNENLRKLHADQLKAIKMLKRLSKRQAAAETSVCVYRNLYPNSFHETERDAVNVLEKLSSSLGKVFGETDRVFRLNGLNVISSPFSKTNIQQVSSTNSYIEILKYDLIPFDVRAVTETFYGKMTAGCGLEEVNNVNVSQAKDQKVVARSFTMELEERVKVQYRYAGIRYSEHNREVIVLAGQNKLIEAFGIALDGVGFHEKSWCVMTEVVPGLCLLHLCIGLTVEVKHLSPGCLKFIDRLCEILTHLKRDTFDSVQREVEHNLLVEKC